MGQELFTREQIEKRAKTFMETEGPDSELADLLEEFQARGATQSMRGALDNMQGMVHGLARSKGWWEAGKEKSITECLCLVHSELSEAVEEIRNGKPAVYFESGIKGEIITPGHASFEQYAADGAKPEGWAVESADAFIRLLDMMEYFGASLADAVILKHEYNATRSYRHGGKAI